MKSPSAFRKPETQTPLVPVPVAQPAPVVAEPSLPTQTPATSAATPSTTSPTVTTSTSTSTTTTTPTPVAAEPAGTFYLQAGAFANRDEAENQRARLALMGLEGKISTTEKDGKTFHRVRLGPFSRPEEASNIRAEMAKNNIEASLVK
jgi:cell division protein FtsN